MSNTSPANSVVESISDAIATAGRTVPDVAAELGVELHELEHPEAPTVEMVHRVADTLGLDYRVLLGVTR